MKTVMTLVLLFVPVIQVWAQPAPEENKITERAAESLRLSTAEAKRFDYFITGDSEKKSKLHPTPVYRFTSPQIGEVYANLFLWTHQGRPVAIASISNWYSPRAYRGLAVTSLSTEKLIGTRDGKEIWHPKSGGLEFKPLADAKPPQKTAAQRLRQMRALAREFTAEFKRDASYPEGGKLRLLSNPLYRYESQQPELIDGAIFGFAFGTSPQLVLLIEARQTASGARWHYAWAPRNSTEYHVRHNGREVWSLPQLAPPWPNSKNPTNTYTVFPDLQREGRTQQFVDQLPKFNRISK